MLELSLIAHLREQLHLLIREQLSLGSCVRVSAATAASVAATTAANGTAVTTAAAAPIPAPKPAPKPAPMARPSAPRPIMLAPVNAVVNERNALELQQVMEASRRQGRAALQWVASDWVEVDAEHAGDPKAFDETHRRLMRSEGGTFFGDCLAVSAGSTYARALASSC